VSDVLDRLRAANPDPAPEMPSIDGVRQRIAQDSDSKGAARSVRLFAVAGRSVLPAVAVAGSLAIGVLALALMGHGRRPTPSTPAAVRLLRAEYSVLRSGQPPSAATQAMLARMLSGVGSYHPLPTFARAIEASNHTPAFLVPAKRGLCVVSSSAIGSFCAPAADTAGVGAVDLCSPTLPANKLQMAWLLPDHVRVITITTTAGTRIHFPSAYNLYIADFATTSPVPASIQWTDAAGHTQSAPAHIPPGAAGERCAHPGSEPTTPSPQAPSMPRVPSAYCVNSTTHKRIPCSPTTGLQPHLPSRLTRTPQRSRHP
jgi:hypothetical protein